MLWKEAESMQDKIVAWRRQLHQIPEVGLELPQTRRMLCGILDEMGVSYRCYEGCSGIEVLIKGKLPGKTIALRSDMDALPIQEQTGLPFASVNGAMHACGHDGHMAMLLAAIAVLKNHTAAMHGNIKCIFQPGEEGYHGAKAMIAEGALEEPHVDAMVGIHVTPGFPELKPGVIGYRSGALMASGDSFQITVTGRGGHICARENVTSPFPSIAKLVIAIQNKREELIRRGQKGVIGVGAVCGGEKENIVPDSAFLRGSIRAMEPKLRVELFRWLEHITSETNSEDCPCNLSYMDRTGMVWNDEQMTVLSREVLESMSDKVPSIELTSEILACEDISDFFEKTKGLYLHLGCGWNGEGCDYQLHSAKFNLNESVLWHGSAALAQYAICWLDAQT